MRAGAERVTMARVSARGGFPGGLQLAPACCKASAVVPVGSGGQVPGLLARASQASGTCPLSWPERRRLRGRGVRPPAGRGSLSEVHCAFAGGGGCGGPYVCGKGIDSRLAAV